MAEYSYKHFLKTICFYPEPCGHLFFFPNFTLFRQCQFSFVSRLPSTFEVHYNFLSYCDHLYVLFGHPQFTIHASSNLQTGHLCTYIIMKLSCFSFDFFLAYQSFIVNQDKLGTLVKHRRLYRRTFQYDDKYEKRQCLESHPISLKSYK